MRVERRCRRLRHRVMRVAPSVLLVQEIAAPMTTTFGVVEMTHKVAQG